MSRPKIISLLLLALTGIAALRSSALALFYVLQTWNVERRHVEAAGFILAATLLGCALASRDMHRTRSAAFGLQRGAILVIVGVGLLLFWPSLSIGLLSDDFVLLDRAAQWQLLPADWEYVRPVPLALWGLISGAFGASNASSALHALNLTLHLTNAALVYVAAIALGMSTRGALIAGSLFTVFPTNVEAVSWASGIFDIVLTTVLLILVLVALRSRSASWNGAIAVAALTLVALGTKETAAATPLILAAAALTSARWNTLSNYWAAAVAALCVAPYAALRLFWHPAHAAWPTSGYELKELLSRPIASLIIPLHIDTMTTWPLAVAPAAAAIPIFFFAAAYAWVAGREGPRLAVALTAWTYAAVAPLMTMMFVAPDLQGSRYLYLSAVAWSLLLATSEQLNLAPYVRRLIGAALLGQFVLYTLATNLYVETWRDAAIIRDTFLMEVEQAAARCETASFNVPDNHRGAFVLRNGAIEALRLRGVTAINEGPVIRLPGC